MISFLIPWRSDYGYRETAFQFVHQTLLKEWPDQEVLYGDSGDEIFSRSASRNLLAEKAKGDIFVFVDADSYVPCFQLRYALERVTDWCFPYDLYYSLTAPGSLKFMTTGEADQNDCVYIFPDPVHPFDRPPSVGGCVVVSREGFDAVGGYDERFIGWSFEDRAFAYSLETMYGRAPRIAGPLYHLWHPETSTDQFAQPHMRTNQALCSRYQDALGDINATLKIIDERP